MMTHMYSLAITPFGSIAELVAELCRYAAREMVARERDNVLDRDAHQELAFVEAGARFLGRVLRGAPGDLSASDSLSADLSDRQSLLRELTEPAWHRTREDKIAERVCFQISSDERVELLDSTFQLALLWRRQIDGLQRRGRGATDWTRERRAMGRLAARLTEDFKDLQKLSPRAQAVVMAAAAANTGRSDPDVDYLLGLRVHPTSQAPVVRLPVAFREMNEGSLADVRPPDFSLKHSPLVLAGERMAQALETASDFGKPEFVKARLVADTKFVEGLVCRTARVLLRQFDEVAPAQARGRAFSAALEVVAPNRPAPELGAALRVFAFPRAQRWVRARCRQSETLSEWVAEGDVGFQPT